jgi:hypothetical protein
MQRKFSGVDPSIALHALTYFKEVEGQTMPEMLMRISWEGVKRGLTLVRERGIDRGDKLSR